MKIRFLLSIAVLVGSPVLFAQQVPQAALEREAALERAVQTATSRQPAGILRFFYLRYYKPNEQFFQPSDSEEAAVRSLAVYLVNMYASQRVYGTQAPATLTLDYIGVLDGFEKNTVSFPYRQGRAFYQQHQAAVDALVDRFLQQRTYPWERPSPQERARWIGLLEKAPLAERRAVYEFPKGFGPSAPLPPETVRLNPWLAQAIEQINKQVVLYDEPDLQLADLDSHIGNHTYRRKRTYRWVKDECHYSSYLIARKLAHAIATGNNWGHTRLYTLTATPKQGEFLTPAHGARFQLADGSDGLHWRYHTAVLVILNEYNRYTPVVLDTFLAGQEPVPLAQWIRHFSSRTVFRAQPFTRSQTIEQALHIPDKLDKNTVWVDGKPYLPAEVLR